MIHLLNPVSVSSLDEQLNAAADSNISLKTTPYESDSERCPFKTRHGLSIFESYTYHPDHAVRFAQAMGGITRSTSYKSF